MLTDVDPASTGGLKQNVHTFGVDGSALPATTSLDLFVRRAASGALVVRWQEQGFLGHAVDTLELDGPSAEQKVASPFFDAFRDPRCRGGDGAGRRS